MTHHTWRILAIRQEWKLTGGHGLPEALFAVQPTVGEFSLAVSNQRPTLSPQTPSPESQVQIFSKMLLVSARLCGGNDFKQVAEKSLRLKIIKLGPVICMQCK